MSRKARKQNPDKYNKELKLRGWIKGDKSIVDHAHLAAKRYAPIIYLLFRGLID